MKRRLNYHPKKSLLEKVKLETEKVNKLLNHVSMDNITELNEVTYSKAKLINKKIGIP